MRQWLLAGGMSAETCRKLEGPFKGATNARAGKTQEVPSDRDMGRLCNASGEGLWGEYQGRLPLRARIVPFSA